MAMFHMIMNFLIIMPDYLQNDLDYGNDDAVCPSGPSMDGRARLDGRLWKIARLKHVFL